MGSNARIVRGVVKKCNAGNDISETLTASSCRTTRIEPILAGTEVACPAMLVLHEGNPWMPKSWRAVFLFANSATNIVTRICTSLVPCYLNPQARMYTVGGRHICAVLYVRVFVRKSHESNHRWRRHVYVCSITPTARTAQPTAHPDWAESNHLNKLGESTVAASWLNSCSVPFYT